MKNSKLALIAIMALGLSQATGCIFVSDDDPVVSAGVFHATWTLSDSAGPVTCPSVGAEKVSFLFTDSTQMGFDEIFDCDDLAGDTGTLPLDTFTFNVTLLDCPDATPGCPGGADLGMAGPINADFNTCTSIDGEVCYKDLPAIDFVF